MSIHLQTLNNAINISKKNYFQIFHLKVDTFMILI